MPIYVVYMRQGVTIQNLTGNTLATGVGAAKHALQSCSTAVVLVNTGNWAAGLYHAVPAGRYRRRSSLPGSAQGYGSRGAPERILYLPRLGRI